MRKLPDDARGRARRLTRDEILGWVRERMVLLAHKLRKSNRKGVSLDEVATSLEELCGVLRGCEQRKLGRVAKEKAA